MQRQPGLLSHTPATLSARLQGLQRLLRANEAFAAHLAVTEPGLLTFKGADLEARAQVGALGGGPAVSWWSEAAAAIEGVPDPYPAPSFVRPSQRHLATHLGQQQQQQQAEVQARPRAL